MKKKITKRKSGPKKSKTKVREPVEVLEEAKRGERTVYFADAAHFVHGAFIARIWCIVRIFIPTPSGRKRYNVLGVINAITHNFISVCNTTYINHLSVIELLEKIRDVHKDSATPISVFLDNAKYQVCQAVKERAAALKIELMFLPSYSPNLNLIERVWKWLKKDCLNCKYYSTFTEFKTAIDNSINKIITGKAKNELDSLLTLKFQLFDNAIYDRA
jgi:transposase